MSNTAAFRHTAVLLLVIVVIILGASLFHVRDPTWALISGVVCTELELDQARAAVLMRILGTLFGVLMASLVLILWGPGYVSIAFGVFATTLSCHYIPALKNSWRLATATSVMVLVAGSQQHSIVFGEIVALKRALEVVAGSLTAGAISLGLVSLQERWKR